MTGINRRERISQQTPEERLVAQLDMLQDHIVLFNKKKRDIIRELKTTYSYTDLKLRSVLGAQIEEKV